MNARAEAAAPRRKHWEDLTTVPLAILGVAFIGAYGVWVLRPEDPAPVHVVIAVILVVVWLVFLVDVVVRIALTPKGHRWAWVRHHPIDFMSAVLPVFRALRVVGLVVEVPYFRRRSGNAVRARFLVLAVLYALVFVVFIALATLSVERDAPGATIVTFGDAMWWAIVTLATVGYGDTYPVTTPGRWYAVFLMAGGIAILGVASATVISVLNERLAEIERGRHEARAGRPSDADGDGDGDSDVDTAADGLDDEGEPIGFQAREGLVPEAPDGASD
ncbi:potassium channel family protein [Agromyces sp. MMS24-K17]|uniref:potassium channel family protein n=1 Tax=Agromyces sp. MMS24-K17 TaxID=3372850 RepID=UPI00375535C4